MPYERKTIDISRIHEQEDICRQIFDRVTADGQRPLAMVDTYGCQQNEADSEKLRGYLSEMGYSFTQDEFQADVIVVNTCAVREHAEMRVLGNVGALNHTKKNKPGQIIAVCGCMVLGNVFASLFSHFFQALPQGIQLGVSCLLEVTTASRALVALPLPLPLRVALLSGETGFGALAILMQNRALGPTGLMSFPCQLGCQLLHGLISALVGYGLAVMLL